MKTQKHIRRSGFTLIEVLASMAVLMTLVLLMGRLFRDSSTAWRLGMRRADANMEARAVLDFIARDLEQAVADDVLALRLDSYYTLIFGRDDTTRTGPNAGWSSDAIWFVKLDHDPEYSGTIGPDLRRSARQVGYFVGTNEAGTGLYVLRRETQVGHGPAGISCYDSAGGHSEFWVGMPLDGRRGEVLVENISGFEMWCYGVSNAPGGPVYANVVSYNTPSRVIPGTYMPHSDPTTRRGFQFHKLPAYIEIYLGVLDEQDAVRAAEMLKAARSGGGMTIKQVQDFVNQNEKRHVIRVNMMNSMGYRPDR